jgi:hypothetical protein
MSAPGRQVLEDPDMAEIFLGGGSSLLDGAEASK